MFNGFQTEIYRGRQGGEDNDIPQCSQNIESRNRPIQEVRIQDISVGKILGKQRQVLDIDQTQ